jgi:hypothetical protein
MIKQIAAGVVGLGLIGGAGSVAYNDSGDATVKITNPESGVVQSVTLSGGGGNYSCPDGTSEKVEPHDIRLGRIQLTMQQVRRQIRTIERRYPGNVAPPAVVHRYNALADRDDRLVDAYNAEVDARNAIIDRDCTPD